MEVLKVSSKSAPNSVAGAIAGVIREFGCVEVQAVGAGAANHVADTKNIHSGFTFLWRSSGRPGSRRENLKMGQSAGRKSLSPRK